MEMEIGGVKKKDEGIEAGTSLDGSYGNVTLSDEENEIRILKWKFELMLNAMDDTKGPR